MSPADELETGPIHPYTEALLSAVPDIDSSARSGVNGGRPVVARAAGWRYSAARATVDSDVIEERYDIIQHALFDAVH